MLRISTGEIVVAGPFALAGGVAVHNVARWNGVAWASLGIVLQRLPISEPVRLVGTAGCAAVTLLVIALLAERLFGERSEGERVVHTGQ